MIVMKEKNKESIGKILIICMFLFVGIAVNVNIHDILTGSNYAFWLNIIGFFLVPIVGFCMYIWYKKEIKIIQK